MSHPTLNVLFVCEANSIRSIMAEAILNRFGGDRFTAFSAGFEPAAELHPLTVEMAQASGIGIGHLKPKSVREFTLASAPRMDFVIAMGKNPARALGGFPGNPMHAQWGISDPLTTHGDLMLHRSAFRRAWQELETRIRLFVLLRHHSEPSKEILPLRQEQSA
ncbi:MAG TPA: arsenate reductase ArsC [Candidatus Binataceae bacterium]|nr:arsenate reductase ArsC [Candidatus Binataceae bacterium]